MSLFSRRPTLWHVLVVAALFAAAFAYLSTVQHQTGSAVQSRLQARQARSIEQFDAWFEERRQQARLWADRPATRELIVELLRHKEASAAELNVDARQTAFRQTFALAQAHEGLYGYFVITPEGRTLGSLAVDNTGTPNLLWQEPEFVAAMREHGAAVSPLMASDVKLQNSGVAIDGRPLTLFIGVPVYLDGGAEPAAYFALRIAPISLLALQGQARVGYGGVSFLVDRLGRLHADRSWLNLDLDQYGLDSETFRGRPYLFARDPGKNLLTDPGTEAHRGSLPLTRSAAGVQRGSGASLEPYRDHRGVEVVGSWTWDTKLGLGVITEIPATEAFAPIAAARLHLLIALTTLTVIGIGLLLLRLHRSGLRLQAALINAEAASRAKGVFVANMSHEIRTPLNAVLGIAHLLGNTALTPTQQNYVRMIGTSGEALLGILNDILDYSKVEAGKLELASADFSLYDMFDTLSSIMSINASPKDLELVIGIEPDVPTTLIGDSLRLLQILVNLTGNAIKFTQRGEVVLRVGAESRDGDAIRVRFEVRDTGVGIPADKITHLFDAFTQADAGIARHYGGSGLGLAICKRLVDLMGGELGVTSVEGQGSTFWFSVPLAVGAAAPVPAPPLLAVQDVLVVDDNAIAREFVSKSVERLGWNAREVPSGADAIDTMTSRAFDVLLIDWNMPDLDGLQTSKAIRALQGVSQPPIVIMVTAFGREQVLASADANVIDAVIDKPTTPSKILDAVMEARAKHQGGYQVQHRLYSPPRAVRRLLGLRVLLVEDNYINQQVARGLLETEGASISTADHGAAALELLGRRPDAFDLVLMDVQMPVMDGLEATRRIRTLLRLTLPIVAMSAGVTSDERQLCLAAGMNDFIAKPLDPHLLVRTARRLGLNLGGDPADPAEPPTSPQPTAEAGTADALPPIEGIEMDELMVALNGSREAVLRLLAQFAATCESAALELQAAARAERADNLAATLHGLKGVAMNMRANRSVARIEAVEAALRGGGLDAVRSQALPALAAEVLGLRDAIRRAVG